MKNHTEAPPLVPHTRGSLQTTLLVYTATWVGAWAAVLLLALIRHS